MTTVLAALHFVVFTYLLIVIARGLLDMIRSVARSWRPAGPMLVAAEVVYTVTDPPLRALRRVTGMDFRLCPDMIEASSDTSSLQAFSGILRRIAVKLSKICNPLRARRRAIPPVSLGGIAIDLAFIVLIIALQLVLIVIG